MKKFSCAILVACFLMTWAQAQSHVRVYTETKHDVSLPLRDMAKLVAVQKHVNYEVDAPRALPTHQSTTNGSAEAAVVSDGSGPLVATTNLLNFDGQSADGVAPPDTTGAVGGTQYVQWVNLEYNVYDKTTGSKILGPVQGNAFWSGFGGTCSTSNSGDPIVIYDKAAGRWFAAQNTFSGVYTICLAVSTTGDATGSYNRYSFAVSPSTNFPDYPKWGVWSDGYYQSFNAFKNGVTFNGSEVCAADRTSMLAGSAATIQCFSTANTQGGLLPADIDGLTQPPAGAAEYFLNWSDTTHINFWRFHVDFVTPSNSTFTGPTQKTVAAFTQVCPSTRACVPEPSGGEKVDSLGDRMMYRVSYRNFGTYESILASQTVKPTGTSTATTAVRWYEFRTPNTPTVYQSGTYQNMTTSLWMPSIAQDKQGNIALGFAASSSTVNPSVWYVGRNVTDVKGKMQAPFKAVVGTGVQKSTSNRWGDYSTMQVDPSDDCTFWYTQEYYKTTGSFNWATRINSFKFTSCN